MKKLHLFIIIFISFLLCAACQPTPEGPIVIGKDELSEGIQTTAAPNGDADPSASGPWRDEKEYPSGRKLIVDAELPARPASVPVLSISEKKFESGEMLKKIVDVFCPNQAVYDKGDKITKSVIQSLILYYKEVLFRIDNDMPPLWKREYLCFEVQDGAIVKINWENPSQILGVDNENVQILPWEEIQNLFYTQMDFLLLPELAQEFTLDARLGTKEVHISRVEFGLTKILLKDSRSNYKLIPTWSFMGYTESTVSDGESQGATICFLTLNAIDGSLIDLGLMY
ncbi:MAG: DUF6034 family protein [Clostridiales bacterium]|nr:DUF6034 family protein [Clostridiales bacterium]